MYRSCTENAGKVTVGHRARNLGSSTSQRGGVSHRALTEPYVSLSAHTALAIHEGYRPRPDTRIPPDCIGTCVAPLSPGPFLDLARRSRSWQQRYQIWGTLEQVPVQGGLRARPLTVPPQSGRPHQKWLMPFDSADYSGRKQTQPKRRVPLKYVFRRSSAHSWTASSVTGAAKKRINSGKTKAS